MTKYTLAALGLALASFAGCANMEQYHRPVTLDNVPTDVLAAFSTDYPAAKINAIEEQKLYSGTTAYTFDIVTRKKETKLARYNAAGQQIP